MATKRRLGEKKLKVIRSRRSQTRQRVARERERAQARREAKRIALLKKQTPPSKQMEELIASLRGVRAARTVVEEGLLTQIHVVTDTRWSLRQMRFIIRTALSAKFGFLLPYDVWINQAKFDELPPELLEIIRSSQH